MKTETNDLSPVGKVIHAIWFFCFGIPLACILWVLAWSVYFIKNYLK